MPFMTVQIKAVRLVCNACGSYVRIELHDDAWERATNPAAYWWFAHRAPKLVLVEADTDRGEEIG